MTIASTTSRISYTGDGVTLAFAVPFYFQANADLVVTLTDTLGAATTQVLSTNYSLTGATLSAGGTCTFVIAPPSGYLITIYRDPPMTQTQSYNNNDPFPAKSHELALDKALTIDQRTRDLIGRALRLSDAEPASTVTTLAAVATRKNKLLGFDTAGALTYVVGPTFVSATGTGVAVVDSRATAQVTTFAGSVNVVVTRGATAPGDGGGLDYVRGIAASPTPFQDGSGVYWTPATVLGLAANAVTTAAITNAAVTYAKLQNVAASRLLGNPTGGAAAPSEISLGTGLIFSGTTAQVDPAIMFGQLHGLTLSAAGGTGVFGIAVGAAADTTTGAMMVLASAFTKSTNAWAVGTGNGSLDTGVIAAGGWYHAFLIKRVDTGVVDILISLSATAPTMPTGYTLSRRIGSMKTDGSSQWTKFYQNADTFLWDVLPAVDYSVTNPGTAAVTVTTATPTGVRCDGIFNVSATLNASSFTWLISSLDITDTAPVFGGPPLGHISLNFSAAMTQGAQIRCWTNTSAQIRSRLSNSGASISVIVQTTGWVDQRGK